MEMATTAKSPQITPGRSKSEHKHVEHYLWCMQCSDQNCPLQQKMVFEDTMQVSNTDSSKSGSFFRAVCNRISLRKKSEKAGSEKNGTTVAGAKHLAEFGEKLNAHQKIIQKKQRAVSADSPKNERTSGFVRAGQFMRSHRARFSLRKKSKKGGSPNNKSKCRESIVSEPTQMEKRDKEQKEKDKVSSDVTKPDLTSRFSQLMRSGRARLSLRKKSKKVGLHDFHESNSLGSGKSKSMLTRQENRCTSSRDIVKVGSNSKWANDGGRFIRSSQARFTFRKNPKKDESSYKEKKQEIFKTMDALKLDEQLGKNEELKPLRRYNGRSRLDQFIMNGGQLKPLQKEAKV